MSLERFEAILQLPKVNLLVALLAQMLSAVTRALRPRGGAIMRNGERDVSGWSIVMVKV